jgi:GT2 family glycosyltransferase
VGVVVIGRNEGDRLSRCLDVLVDWDGPVVYVDSASKDGSVERARNSNAHVLELDANKPLSASRGRNAGFEYLATGHPSLRYVQFIDGDCEIEADWLEHAAAALDEHPEWAIVCGRLHEHEPHASIYNRLCDLE